MPASADRPCDGTLNSPCNSSTQVYNSGVPRGIRRFGSARVPKD